MRVSSCQFVHLVDYGASGLAKPGTKTSNFESFFWSTEIVGQQSILAIALILGNFSSRSG